MEVSFQASEFLSRGKRASNRKHFEEIRPGNLERECIEEDCNKTELLEVSIVTKIFKKDF